MRPPESWKTARATLAIAAVTAAAWLLTTAFGFQEQAVLWGGFIPLRVTHALAESGPVPVLLTPLTATLVHADFLHLAFNLLFLMFCGRSVEGIIGARGDIVLYLVGAFAAAAAFWASAGPQSLMFGASGAVSAVIGAYPMFFGRHRIRIANNLVALIVNALWLAAAWIGLQLLIGLASPDGASIATAAHIGGFLAGLLLARPLLMLRWRKA